MRKSLRGYERFGMAMNWTRLITIAGTTFSLPFEKLIVPKRTVQSHPAAIAKMPWGDDPLVRTESIQLLAFRHLRWARRSTENGENGALWLVSGASGLIRRRSPVRPNRSEDLLCRRFRYDIRIS